MIEGTARVSRCVLLCERGECTTTKLTMNVSIKTSCFRSKTHPQSSCRQSIGRIEAPPPLAAAVKYRLTIAGGSISGLLRKHATANSFTPASCYSWSSKRHTNTRV